MEKLKQNAGDIFARVFSGFSHGLGQMGSAGQSGSPLPYEGKSPEDAFRSDWEKVGSDLRGAILTVREKHGEKA